MEPREAFQSQSQIQPTTLNTQGISAPASLLPGLEQRLILLRSTTPAQTLFEAFASEQWEVRVSAIQSAASLGENAPVALLLQALRDEHRFVRIAATRALRQASVPHATGYLLAALQDRDWQVREMAALTLGETGDPTAEPALTAALQDPSSNVREAATLAALKRARTTNSPPSTSVPVSIQQPQPATERIQQTMAITPSTPQTPAAGTAPATAAAPMPAARKPRKLRKGTRLLLLGAVAAILLTVLTAASFDLGWWNPLFGNPNLYQTVGLQQSSHGVTITVTKVYADEGRTIIAYEINGKDASKSLIIGTYNLTSPTPQKQEPIQATECDAPHQGLTHCYMIQPAFLVPTGTQHVTITWDITRILVVQPGSAQNFPPITGHWHFTFTVPFHHTNNKHIPNPIHGGVVVG